MPYAITHEAKRRLAWYLLHDPPIHAKMLELIADINRDPNIGSDQVSMLVSNDQWQVRVSEALILAKFDVPPNAVNQVQSFG